MNFFLYTIVVAAIVLASCSAPSVKSEENENPVTVESSSAQNAVPEVITVEASNYAFTPAAIHLRKGQKVVLRVVSTEETHGISIPLMNITAILRPGEPLEIPIPTDVAGTFDFFCSIPCGSGHAQMQGTIIIE